MRARIVDAAEQMVVEQGVRAATTKALARAAGCAEGTLYVHFPDRMAILAAIFEARWPQAADALAALQQQVGSGSVVDNLTSTLLRIESFLAALEPLVAALKSDPSIAEALQRRWRDLGAGPHTVVEGIADYVAAEQAAGRVSAHIDPRTAGEVLMGFLFYVRTSSRFSSDPGATLTEARLRKVVCINVSPCHD
jgi:AcrR family transcriptional regulator